MTWIRNMRKQSSSSGGSGNHDLPGTPSNDDGNGQFADTEASPADPSAADTDASEEQEPSTREWFLALKRELHQQVISTMDISAIGTMGEEQLQLEVRRQAETLCSSRADLLSLAERERLVNEVLHETFGLGPLEPLMADPDVSDILINGPRSIYIERKGRLEKTSVAFHDEKHVLQVVQRIVGRVGRRVDETCPMVDARLLDGSRLNAIIHPLALDGPLVSIRRFGARP
ncbi:MAG: ATPase, T2SS/T4P/T4SS family, partial [Thermoguttaceae bacterium]